MYFALVGIIINNSEGNFVGDNTNKGIKKDFRIYEWSSYQRITIEKPSKLQKEAVLAWFGGRNVYFQFHEGIKNISIPDGWKLEDEAL